MKAGEERLAVLDAFVTGIGSENVVSLESDIQRYAYSTNGISRKILFVVKPKTVQQIQVCVKIASSTGVSLYPVSTGRNWGYGGANPVMNGCVLVDLSGMTNITDFNEELGLVTVEPGVTQRQLDQFLSGFSKRYLVPATGAGPEASVLGNALERGYGLTPIADHFLSLNAIEAILPDGRIFRPLLSELGGDLVSKAFRWDVGPLMDGLFTQGNMGIVTRGTIALAPVPENVTAFLFSIRSGQGLESLVTGIRRTIETVGGNLGSINLMNDRRVLSMMIPYPEKYKKGKATIPDDEWTAIGKRHQVMTWNCAGTIYGDKRIVGACKKAIRSILSSRVDRLVFLSGSLINFGHAVFRLFPGTFFRNLEKLFDTLKKTHRLMEGHPSEIALPLTYWRSGRTPENERRNPDLDGCGLIWYSPLVPMLPESVREYTTMVKTVCPRFGIEPLITLTSVSSRCFDSTIPILFDRNDPEALERARACYDALFREGKKLGFLPYRLSVDQMRYLAETPSVARDLYSRLKDAVDPAHVIAPGRYSTPAAA